MSFFLSLSLSVELVVEKFPLFLMLIDSSDKKINENTRKICGGKGADSVQNYINKEGGRFEGNRVDISVNKNRFDL